MNRTIKLYGFSRNDELVFTSLISLLSNKTPYQWDVVDADSAQVAVVDVDKFADNKILDDLQNQVDQIVTYGNRQLDEAYPVLTKPLRAASILKCLSSLAEMGEPAFVESEEGYQALEKVYRLKRWPTPELLKSNPGAARICAVLLKQPCSIESVSEMVGMDSVKVGEFVKGCIDQGLVLEKERASSNSYHKKTPHPLHPIFSKLRAKFGARG